MALLPSGMVPMKLLIMLKLLLMTLPDERMFWLSTSELA